MNITTIAAVVSSAAFVFTAVFVLYQVVHMRVACDVEISMKLFEWAESERHRAALRWVQKEFVFTDYDQFVSEYERRPDVEDAVLCVLSFFEHVGLLVEKRFVNVDVVMDHLGFEIVICWRKLASLIRAWRDAQENAHVGRHFEMLYHKAEAYVERVRQG